jgi:hypothetical protein
MEYYVIVNAIPEYCEDCKYFEHTTYIDGSVIKCVITNKELDISKMNKPPNWCPLMTLNQFEKLMEE